jgi:hypothetical protein
MYATMVYISFYADLNFRARLRRIRPKNRPTFVRQQPGVVAHHAAEALAPLNWIIGHNGYGCRLRNSIFETLTTGNLPERSPVDFQR